MKILHSADWHLDAPLTSRRSVEAAFLRKEMLALPDKIVETAKSRGCDMILLSGDLFDGAYTPESLHALRRALEEVAMPVFIAPGNHDFVSPDSLWLRESWPDNVHIFTQSTPQSVGVPELDCRVYGAAFHSEESGSLLAGFRAEGSERYCVGVFHGDPTVAASPYNPVSTAQIGDSALDYLALGHIHRAGKLVSGGTLCAWPGCPMGKGFDELGQKGVLIVTLDSGCSAEFLPLNTTRFFDLEVPVGEDAAQSIRQHLHPVGSTDFYRITLTGEGETPDLQELRRQFPEYPHLQLRERTVPPMDVWAAAGEDTLEGTFFGILRRQMEGQDEETSRRIRLAAKISRQLLLGREVKLP